ncbi:tryptophan synthase subunit alpha [Hymenobacter baengnokdamensis]|uniref:tryptophan synthase subunit alpha n=1 Tax=Hymenobacter baengnokdamensis TaxID=2615203 RepID=UPI0012479B33|nr:tryptophan synthase subunit alpha [Hymenobacter baengnokdamensis]
MNRLTKLFQHKTADVLNVYFTAGFPQLNDTVPVLRALQEAGADLVEIGMPYSDPVADGETIQRSNQQALENGMTVGKLFEQLQDIRQQGITVPILLMGYLNPVVQFGVEKFCQHCQVVGIDGVILPDLPLEVYEREYRPLFAEYGLKAVFLVTPQTSAARVRQLDALADGFIYLVAAAGTTGAQTDMNADVDAYLSRTKALGLRNPTLVGFGISDAASFAAASRHTTGAIIGSAFIRLLQQTPAGERTAAIHDFVAGIRPVPA